MPLYYMDPGDKLDFALAWASLLSETDSLSTSAWAVSPSGPTLSGQQVSGSTTSVFVENLAAGLVYALKNTVETAEGRRDSDEITLVAQKPPVKAGEVLAMLPNDTAVSFQEVQGFVGTAAHRIAANHEGNLFPYTPMAEDLVRRYAEARAWKAHYMKGEGWLETNPADKLLEAIEADFAAYDASHSTPEETLSEAQSVVVTELPW